MTGTSGKVGRFVAKHLAATHTLTGVDRAPGPHTQLQSDLVDIRDWTPLFADVEAVVHFAALHAPHRESHSAAAFVRLNVEVTERMLAAARDSGVQRFVLASTTSVYGRAMKGQTRATWVTESLAPEPEDIYDETKLAAEALCADAFSPDFITVSLRFSRCFAEPLRDMALYRLYRGVAAEDVAQAFAGAIALSPGSTRNSPPIGEFQVFNISAPSPFLEEDGASLMRDAASVIRLRAPQLANEFTRRGWALPQSIDRVYVIDKAKAQLGFAPAGDYRAFLAKLPGY